MINQVELCLEKASLESHGTLSYRSGVGLGQRGSVLLNSHVVCEDTELAWITIG